MISTELVGLEFLELRAPLNQGLETLLVNLANSDEIVDASKAETPESYVPEEVSLVSRKICIP